MELGEARELAAGLMAAHRLAGWTLVFDDAKARAGVCRPARKEIGLSRALIRLYSAEQVTETVLHEIAHALAGPGHGHDRVWRAIAVRIGCSGARCVAEGVPSVEGAWVGICPAGHRVTAHRRPGRVRSCSRCSPRFDRFSVFEWTRDGEPAPMLPAYRAELARLRTGGSGRSASGAGGSGRQAAPSGGSRSAGSPGGGSVGSGPSGERSGSPGRPVLRVGDRVLLTGRGRYGGLVGTIVKQGRSRYHVQTRSGLLTAPFAMVEPAGPVWTTAPEAGPG